MDREVLTRVIRDAVAQKRVIKWGYVRQLGGLYPSECDSVAAHSNAVSALAVILAIEYGDALSAETGATLGLEEISLMATFHDYGEGRSGDTGASSFSVRGYCNLHPLEREGLAASLAGLKCQDRILRLWDDYRAYRTPEAILVHIADNLEGFEKALHAARGAREVIGDVLRLFNENLDIYASRKEIDEGLGRVAEFLVDKVLVPGHRILAAAYGVEIPGNSAIHLVNAPRTSSLRGDVD